MSGIDDHSRYIMSAHVVERATARPGFAHQRPQVFQVLTSARLRDRSLGRVHVSFVSSVSVGERDTVVRNTPTGMMRVSSIETTVMDLVWMPIRSGGLSNVATVISEVLACFAPYRPEGYASRRAVLNLQEKIDDPTFREDLRPLVPSWPDGYLPDAAAKLVIDQLLSRA